MKNAIESWTEPGKRRQEFYVSAEQFNWQIYDLFGSCGLTTEILGYLFALLAQSKSFQPTVLFKRLHDFYLRWCTGEFISTPSESLAQRKLRNLREQMLEYPEELEIRFIDVAVGLNVLILLFELDRYAQTKSNLKDQIAFYPCGKQDAADFDKHRLLKIIGYSHSLHPDSFWTALRKLLSRGKFGGANLRGTFLRGADLRDADLNNTFLRGAYLCECDLSRANFSDARMYGVFLDDSNLQGASFTNANLLYSYLSGADLQGANFTNANLAGIVWNDKTNWERVRGLETARNVPIALKQQLGLE